MENFYTHETLECVSGDPKGQAEIEWKVVEHKGLFIGNGPDAIKAAQKILDNSGPEVMAIWSTPIPPAARTILIKPQYAHRFETVKS